MLPRPSSPAGLTAQRQRTVAEAVTVLRSLLDSDVRRAADRQEIGLHSSSSLSAAGMHDAKTATDFLRGVPA